MLGHGLLQIAFLLLQLVELLLLLADGLAGAAHVAGQLADSFLDLAQLARLFRLAVLLVLELLSQLFDALVELLELALLEFALVARGDGLRGKAKTEE